jgi:hypothetical protein
MKKEQVEYSCNVVNGKYQWEVRKKEEHINMHEQILDDISTESFGLWDWK